MTFLEYQKYELKLHEAAVAYDKALKRSRSARLSDGTRLEKAKEDLLEASRNYAWAVCSITGKAP